MQQRRAVAALVLFVLLISGCGSHSLPGLQVAQGVQGASEAVDAFDLEEWTAEAIVAGAVSRAAPAQQPTVLQLGRPVPDAWDAAPALRAGARPAPRISADGAIILDEASMAVLYEKDAYTRRGPASTTKIATAILAAEADELDAVVVSDVDARDMPGSSVMGLRKGDEFTLRDLVYGLMLPSGNDAALVIGRHLAGDDRAFAEQMTLLARRLGLTETHFTNPHGLSHPEHYSTAYDLAVLARYMMTIPFLREVVGSSSYTAKGSRTISMYSGNALLRTYRGSDGVKTGFTHRSGKTYVGSAVRDGHRIYVVLLNSPQREADAAALLDWAFASHQWRETATSPCARGPPPPPSARRPPSTHRRISRRAPPRLANEPRPPPVPGRAHRTPPKVLAPSGGRGPVRRSTQSGRLSAIVCAAE
jgi:D-alanyl-D-alanine carboxypeptidase